MFFKLRNSGSNKGGSGTGRLGIVNDDVAHDHHLDNFDDFNHFVCNHETVLISFNQSIFKKKHGNFWLRGTKDIC